MIRKLKIGETYYELNEVNVRGYWDVTDGTDVWVDENNYQHNEPGLPSYLWYRDEEKKELIFEEYRKHGKLHNLNGYATLQYTNKGQIMVSSYWIDGKCYEKDEFDIEVNRIKILDEI